MPEVETGTKRTTEDTNYVYNEKMMKSDNAKMRLLLVGRYCGLIVGKGGENLGRLRKEYNVALDMPASRSADRVLTVDGTVDSCVDLVKDIAESCCKQAPYPVGGKCTYELNLIVHTGAVGMVIGKGGEKLKQIRDATQGLIKVYQECLPESSERVVAIGGETEEQLLACLKMALSVVKDARVSQPLYYYNPSNKPSEIMGGGITGSGMSMMDQRPPQQGMNQHQHQHYPMPNTMQPGGASDPFQELQTETHIIVPNEMVGAIIGKSGVRIREIKATSGAKIDFTESDKETKADRTVSIIGTQHQVNVAEQLMAQCVRNRTN